jgi:hypothetical protein
MTVVSVDYVQAGASADTRGMSKSKAHIALRRAQSHPGPAQLRQRTRSRRASRHLAGELLKSMAIDRHSPRAITRGSASRSAIASAVRFDMMFYRHDYKRGAARGMRPSESACRLDEKERSRVRPAVPDH